MCAIVLKYAYLHSYSDPQGVSYTWIDVFILTHREWLIWEWNRCRRGVSTRGQRIFVCKIFFFPHGSHWQDELFLTCDVLHSSWKHTSPKQHPDPLQVEKKARPTAVKAPKCQTRGAQSRFSKYSRGVKVRNEEDEMIQRLLRESASQRRNEKSDEQNYFKGFLVRFSTSR